MFDPLVRPVREVPATPFEALQHRNALLTGMARPILDELGRPVKRSAAR
nr:hypothetical protein [uncultured Brevundimonas sp.]